MACQLLHSAAIIICKMPHNAIAQIGHDSVEGYRYDNATSSWPQQRSLESSPSRDSLDCSYWP